MRLRPGHTRGITLIELLVVLAVLVMLMGVGIAGLDRISGTALRTQTNQLSAAIRHAYNRSVAEGLYVRLVLSPDTDQYRVEASSERVFIDIEDDARDADNGEEKGRIDADEAAERPIRKARFDALIPNVAMTRGIGIYGAITTGREDVITSGESAIHFFPSGFVQPAIIYTTDGDGDFFTLRINPMTGHVTRFPGRVEPDRNFGQPDRVEDEGR